MGTSRSYPSRPGGVVTDDDTQIPLNPPFSKGEVFLLPLAKGGGEGFYGTFFMMAKKLSPPTKRKRTAHPLVLVDRKEEAGMFQAIAELGNDGILVFDKNHRIEYANRVASEVTGYRNEQLLEMTILSLLDKPHQSFIEDLFIHPERYGEKTCAEAHLITSTGEVKEAEICIALAKTSHGIRKGYAYLKDITDRKKYESDLKNSEEKLRRLFDRVRHGLFISSKEGKFLECNQALLDMMGYTDKEEFLKIDIARDLYVNPKDREIFMERTERDGFVKDMEVEFRKRNGDNITILLTGHPIKNEKGEIIGYEGINLDITERKRIEDELREANEFFTNLIKSSVDGIIAANMQGNIFIFNKGAEALSGYKADEVIGKVHITQIYPEGIAKEIMKRLRSPDYGGVGKLLPTQFNVVNKEGEEIPIQISAALIYNRAGQEVASVGIFTDLRSRLLMEKKLQETHLQLVSSEKMASLGKLAAGIAHEINNPLGGILIYSSLMLEDLPEEDPKRGDLARIVQEAGRCKEIVKGLLEFARQTEPKREPTDINRAINDGLFFLVNQALFHNIRIVKELDPFLPFVRGNSGQLKQVFMNIIVNAAEAMHGNGTLTIRTSVSADRKTVWIGFTDTGEGIPEENLSRIFDPFFTTKDVGKGTGLGLATSFGIIEEHGGKISVNSKVGEGATFAIELPVHLENNQG
ncbi:MAG: PAS domain S-box protein [Deltaproteobacteria bacterium]|nr:PAS domain S-box protein [Deltaproteobacteria bacterium]